MKRKYSLLSLMLLALLLDSCQPEISSKTTVNIDTLKPSVSSNRDSTKPVALVINDTPATATSTNLTDKVPEFLPSWGRDIFGDPGQPKSGGILNNRGGHNATDNTFIFAIPEGREGHVEERKDKNVKDGPSGQAIYNR